jgi:hypothetical protein
LPDAAKIYFKTEHFKKDVWNSLGKPSSKSNKTFFGKILLGKF